MFAIYHIVFFFLFSQMLDDLDAKICAPLLILLLRMLDDLDAKAVIFDYSSSLRCWPTWMLRLVFWLILPCCRSEIFKQ
ncbi:hypothetical protein BRADI_4g02526v3 [Brachypodium distachyon]|uniref:Uncharacterized protein n=1 Tax=Brachypodium distachyon TaxID=15368 RepID=A0A2K2CK47_BRADI|nr:hypothetical protein BRADI_4g02526v3 [Brachypodium distachyon]